MKIGVSGLWHLGVMYAIGLAELGHEVQAYDPDANSISKLRDGHLLVHEPGLGDLLTKNVKNKRLSFSNTEAELRDSDLFVLAYDTPVDNEDNADVEYVFSEFKRIANYLTSQTTVMVCSQLPVGTSRRITEYLRSLGKECKVIVQPENLRLGRAINSFFNPGRIVVGTVDGQPNQIVQSAFAGIDAPILWMHQESAELTKHALNAFLATSVTFMGELAEICEHVGADAKEVESGLKSDSRVGMKAYLSPGLGFAGGTLARDVKRLSIIQNDIRKDKALLTSILDSNKYNNEWVSRSLNKLIGQFDFRKICFWGVSYVENTDTLRRSEIYLVMQELAQRGFEITFVENFPIKDSVDSNILAITSTKESLLELDILVISKNLVQDLEVEGLLEKLKQGNFWILDPSRVLVEITNQFFEFSAYLTVGYGK